MSDRIFKDSAGTPAGYGDTVELIKDKLGNDRLGPELVTNGSFDDGTASWSVFQWELVDGKASLTDGDSKQIRQSIGITPNSFYKLEFDIVTLSGSLIINLGGSVDTTSITGRFSQIILSSDLNDDVRLISNSFTGTVDNISVREVLGSHAIQPSASLKPVLGRVPVGGRRNLAPNSEGGFVGNAELVDQPIEGFPGKPTYRFTQPAPGELIYAIAYVPSFEGVKTFSVFVEMDDGSTPIPSTNEFNGDFRMVIENGGANSVGVEQVTATVFRCWATRNGQGSNANFGVYKYAEQSGKSFRVIGYQLEAGDSVTPYQSVTNDIAVYEKGQQHIEYLRFDGIDDCMTQTFPDGFEGDLIVCGTKGSWIDEGVSIPPGGELTIGPKNLPNTPNILPALGDIIGWVPVSRTTTEEERQRIIEYYKGRGAKGRLVPSGVELVTNGTFDTADGWTLQNGWEISDGLLKLTGDVWSTAFHSVDFTPGRVYKVSLDYSTDGPTSYGAMAYIRAGQVAGQGSVPRNTGTFDQLMLGGDGSLAIAAYPFGATTTFDNISVRELIPEEDLS